MSAMREGQVRCLDPHGFHVVRYTEWGDAIANQRHDWLDGFFTDDFLGTAQPWPTLSVNRQQMLDLDKAGEAMDTEDGAPIGTNES